MLESSWNMNARYTVVAVFTHVCRRAFVKNVRARSLLSVGSHLSAVCVAQVILRPFASPATLCSFHEICHLLVHAQSC